ncbi:hypothetical protein LCGC14_2340540 [marine sediment metagenome]|uniref:Uncharacterized protein n=1 Tax=marine sediment metagenome TaxID=412755 RepID=A0A0F9CC25_9ZZZZ
MATLLTKSLNRQTLAVTDHVGRPIVVTLEAGDMISFRARGKRYRYSVSLAAVYNLAIISTVNEHHKERVKVWKEKKKLGIRCRKPKPLPYIFSKQYFEALRIK